jgi:hypothetical protein
VDCTHKGGAGTKEYNVGGPALGANRVDKIIDVAWESLNPGDTVRIHYRDTAYAEKLVLFRSGAEGMPIRVCGVLGGVDGKQRPTITGVDALTRTAASFKSQLTFVANSLQPYGVVVIAANDFDKHVEHLVIENLSIGDTKTGPGRENVVADDAFFTNAQGQRGRFDNAAACFRMRQAQHITLRANEIKNCGDGVFAGSLPDNEHHMIRHLLLEGNYIHGNGIIGDESRHQAYLQGTDIVAQFNVFGTPREAAGVGAMSGNQLKTRAAGLVVAYNYFENGARVLDLVEAQEHISMLAPWQYARWRAAYLGCQSSGCLKLSAAELVAYDKRQQEDWAKYQTGIYVYGNLLHVVGKNGTDRNLPTNLTHYGFDNTQHDRQPGVFWFYNNTVLVQTDIDNQDVVRLFDYGSDFGDGGFYGYSPSLTNVGNELHYITLETDDKTCQTPRSDCTDWGKMQQNVQAEFGRMRAFNNAIVFKPLPGATRASDFEFTRNYWDQLELVGPMWLSDGWDKDHSSSESGGAYGHRALPDANVYPGGNAAHHVTGSSNVVSANGVPIDPATFAPTAQSPLLNAGGPFDARLAGSLKPVFSVTLDPAQKGRLIITPRTSLSTIGAVQ